MTSSHIRRVYKNAFVVVAVVLLLFAIFPSASDNQEPQQPVSPLPSLLGKQPRPFTTKAEMIPKQVFLFWDKGFDLAIPVAQLVKQLAEYQNPDFKFYFLDEAGAEELSERSTYIPDRIWNGIEIQAKSDIYRTLLLYKYGGIWMDASLLANRPFDWLDFGSTDLISFQRFDNPGAQRKQGIKPWITSWFLAAPPQAYMMGKVRDVITNETQFYRFSSKYFWWHEIVSELCETDTYFGERVNSFASADPMHCMNGTDWRRAPVNKRCQAELMASLFAVTKECCVSSDSNAVLEEDVCAEWDCHTIFANEKVFEKRKETIGEAFGWTIPTIESSMYAPKGAPE